MGLLDDASQMIADRLTWCTACRDQAGIASDLAEKKEISEVHGLGEAGLFDEFFCFLEELGIMKLFLKLDPDMRERGSNVKFPAVIPIYLMRIVAGLRFFRHIDIVPSRSPITSRPLQPLLWSEPLTGPLPSWLLTASFPKRSTHSWMLPKSSPPSNVRGVARSPRKRCPNRGDVRDGYEKSWKLSSATRYGWSGTLPVALRFATIEVSDVDSCP